MVQADNPSGLTAKQTARFTRLVMPHLPLLLRTARYLTHHDYQAEDLVQETLIKAMRGIDSFQEGTTIKPWLMLILRRAHIDRIRGEKGGKNGGGQGQTLSLDQAELDVPDRPHPLDGQFDAQWHEPETLLNQFSDADVIAALKTLPEEIRWTLLLVDVEQIDHTQAATILDIPVGTIKSRAHRGRAMLRDRLYGWAKARGWVPDKDTNHD